MQGSLKSCGELKTQIMSHECVCFVDNSFLCFVDKRDGFAVIHVGRLEGGKVGVQQFILWIRLIPYIKREKRR